VQCGHTMVAKYAFEKLHSHDSKNRVYEKYQYLRRSSRECEHLCAP
jgi:hypothetical protein